MARTNIESEDEDDEEKQHEDGIDNGAKDIGFSALIHRKGFDIIDLLSFFSHQ